MPRKKAVDNRARRFFTGKRPRSGKPPLETEHCWTRLTLPVLCWYAAPMSLHRYFCVLVLAAAIWPGCGGGSTIPREQWLRKLRDAIHGEVSSREQNRQNSRLVERALDEGALKNMLRFEVRDALGPGESCQAHPECDEAGFRAGDWYYVVGKGDEAQVGKLPAIVVGFGPHSNVIRTWNRRVH